MPDRTDDAGPGQTKPNHTALGQIKPEQAETGRAMQNRAPELAGPSYQTKAEPWQNRPDQGRAGLTKLYQSKASWTKSNQARPGRTKPDWAERYGPGRTKPD